MKKVLFSMLVILIMAVGCGATAPSAAPPTTGDAESTTDTDQAVTAPASEAEFQTQSDAELEVSSEYTVVLHSIAEEDGNLRPTDMHPELIVGDDVHDKARQAFLSFDISGIPTFSTIKWASLDLTGTKSGEPFAGLGLLNVYNDQYGDLGSEDFTGGPTELDIRAFSLDCPPTGPSTTSPRMISELQKRLNAGEPRFQIRLQFEKQTDLDSEWDFWELTNPELVIVYKEGQ